MHKGEQKGGQLEYLLPASSFASVLVHGIEAHHEDHEPGKTPVKRKRGDHSHEINLYLRACMMACRLSRAVGVMVSRSADNPQCLPRRVRWAPTACRRVGLEGTLRPRPLSAALVALSQHLHAPHLPPPPFACQIVHED